MDGMGGMAALGGMDMSSSGMFLPTNMALAKGFWYGVAACVGLLALIRFIDMARAHWNSRVSQQDVEIIPSRPRNAISQAYSTLTAVCREISYPQPLVFAGSFTKHLSPPPVGRILIILTYWAVILACLWTNVILKPDNPMYAYHWEIVGFRGAWVSVTQVPLVYCLSSKINVISIITGISYERLNWLHRWSALTLFLTVIVHWTYFFREWWLADMIQMELSIMPIVKYGFGAWAVVGWMALSGFGYFRELNYELWVLQHLAGAGVLLWLLHVHVPSYAAYNIWLAIGFVAFDRTVRGVWAVYRNFHAIRRLGKDRLKRLGFGYKATLGSLPRDVTKIVIQNVDFKWRPGQHVYISIPSVRLFEAHPFTIANSPITAEGQKADTLELYIKGHSGFTSKLLQNARRSEAVDSSPVRILVSGPWGFPPSLNTFDSLVLVGASTGASFTVPLLESITSAPGCVQRVAFHWIIRHEDQLSWFESQLKRASESAKTRGIKLSIDITVTSSQVAPEKQKPCCCKQASSAAMRQLPTTESDPEKEKFDVSLSAKEVQSETSLARTGSSSGESSSSSLSDVQGCQCNKTKLDSGVSLTFGCRPTMDGMVRSTVEAAPGETAVVVCGGASLAAAARTYVSCLSDERAVHKGTGAQGIFLFTETYGW